MIVTYFENQAATITYDPEWELGTARIEGFLNSQEFREIILVGVKLIAEYKPLRWLSDNSKMKVIRQLDQEWYLANALPQILQSSIRRNAIIVSEDIFNKMAVAQLIKRAGNLEDMVLQEFNNEQQALAWLKQPIVSGFEK
ncbi:MAG: STAS/SEC14 domain-containing protein [Adhaeribacter sp.]